MCFKNCLFGNSKKEIYSVNLFKANMITTGIHSNDYVNSRDKVVSIELFKGQIKYKLFTELPKNTSSFHTIFINQLINDKIDNLNNYLGTFVSNTDFVSLSFKFKIIDRLIINDRLYYRIFVELDNVNDTIENPYWYILSTSLL